MQSGLEVLTRERSPRKGLKKRPGQSPRTLRTEMIPCGIYPARRILRERDPAEGCLGAGNVPEGGG